MRISDWSSDVCSSDLARWIDSNYVWWRRYGRKIENVVDTTARPSRQPGRYHVVWDGLDDAGRRAGRGSYLLHVEAAREHGGHPYPSTERSEERRVGKEGVSTCRSRGAPAP